MPERPIRSAHTVQHKCGAHLGSYCPMVQHSDIRVPKVRSVQAYVIRGNLGSPVVWVVETGSSRWHARLSLHRIHNGIGLDTAPSKILHTIRQKWREDWKHT